MKIAQIRSMDISNGEGIGVSLFTQSCPFRCKGCHNMSTWSDTGGEEYTQETRDRILELVRRPYISRLSILGGEPLLPQNVDELLSLATRVRMVKPDIKIWLWTGTTCEAICSLLYRGYRGAKETNPDKIFSSLGWDSYSIDALYYLMTEEIDYLVDGRFIQEEKDLALKWKGSSNQRILDCRESIWSQIPCLADIY